MTECETDANLSLTSADQRLRVDFTYRVDRFVQTLFLNDSEVGTSVEGDQGSLWPPSPPIQQLSGQQMDRSLVILGVGAAGRSHWSVSIERDRDPSAVLFDVACRCGQPPIWLGNTYRLAETIALRPATPAGMESATIIDRPEADRATVAVRCSASESGTHRWAFTLCVK